jgi:propane 2-monooxygenase small subunit
MTTSGVISTDEQGVAASFAGSESRQFSYYEPSGPRASVYEDVTVDVQPDISRHLKHGWIYAFADGIGPFDEGSTRLRSSGWHRFRDPNEDWERTLYRHQGDGERQIERVVETARELAFFQHWHPRWVETVATHVCAWMHAEYALGMHVLLPAQRAGPSAMINNAIAINAAHKLRVAQDLALYAGELAAQISSFDEHAHVDAWLESEAWQPTREQVERLTTTTDWAEAVFAANVVFEPLAGKLFRTEFAMRTAPWHGDYVTPALFGLAAEDFVRDRTWSHALFRLLVHDEEHALENRRVLREWLRRWAPDTIAATARFRPLWEELPVQPASFDDARELVSDRWRADLRALRVPNFMTR